MELPSSREYPDYYQVIERPIDLKIIRDKIENNKVRSKTLTISSVLSISPSSSTSLHCN